MDRFKTEEATPATIREQPGRPLDEEAATGELEPSTLIAPSDAEQLRKEWQSVQVAFVDDPQEAVHRADELVKHVVRFIGDAFEAQRARLEDKWTAGDEVSTEDLRMAVQRYRTFFERLLEMPAQ